MGLYDTLFILILNSVFPFVSHLLVLMLPISSGFKFSSFYATTLHESFGASMLTIPDLLEAISHVTEFSPIHTFWSLNIFASSVHFITLFSLDISSIYALNPIGKFDT